MTKHASLFGSCFLALGALASTLAACSLDADIAKSPGADPGAGSSGSSGTSGSSGSSGGDASTVADGGDATVSTGWKPTTFTPGGYVFAGQAGSVASPYLQPSALFQSAFGGSCEERLVAAPGGVTCRVQRCAPGGTAEKTHPHAGAITFEGLVTIQPGPTGAYLLSGISPAWTPWSTVPITAAGGDIPAFSGSIELPAELVVTAPTNTPGISVPVPSPLSKSAGFAAEWVPGPASVRIYVYESFSTPKPTDQPHTVICDAPRSLGALTVPSAAFSEFSTTPLTAGGPFVGIQVTAFAETVKTVGTWRVGFMGTARGAVWEASNQVVP